MGNDLSNWRIAIGTYHASKQHIKLRNNKNHTNSINPLCLVLVSYCLLVTFGNIERNPGPNNTYYYDSLSQEGKQFYKDINKLYLRIERIDSHIFFLQMCIDNNIFPKGFELKCEMQTAFSKTNIQSEVNNMLHLSSKRIITMCLDHYRNSKSLLDMELRELMVECNKVMGPSYAKSCYQKIVYHNKQYCYSLKKTKTKKFENLMKDVKRKMPPISKINQEPSTKEFVEQWWQEDLGLKLSDRKEIENCQIMLSDRHIDAALILLKRHNPIVGGLQSVLLSNLATGYDYMTTESLQIHNNGELHWLTTSTVGHPGEVFLFDSLNREITDDLDKQIRSIYSCDQSKPIIKKIKIQKQVGGVDCGLFAIATATDICHFNNPYEITYDQSKMRKHLIECFNNNLLTPFPRFQQCKTKPEITIEPTEWQQPRRSTRISNKMVTFSSPLCTSFKNKFSPLKDENKKSVSKHHDHSSKVEQEKTVSNDDNNSIHPIPTKSSQNGENVKLLNNNNNKIVNLSDVKLSEHELSLLDKGLTFCPTPKTFNKIHFLKDILSFYRRLRLKEYFSRNKCPDKRSPFLKSVAEKVSSSPSYWSPNPEDKNPILEKFIEYVSRDINKFLNTPFQTKYNISDDENSAIQSLQNNKDIVLKPADKGSAIVIQNRKDYIEECMRQLNDTTFYKELPTDPTGRFESEISNFLTSNAENGKLTKDELTHLAPTNSRTSVFYTLPKIHKRLNKPPGRPIVSGNKSCTEMISHFCDFHLRNIVSKTKSYIKDSYDFLDKIKKIKNLPKETLLVTMDVSSLYTNIDHVEGIDAVRSFLMKTHSKQFTDFICGLLNLILSCNYFRFGNKYFLQIMGTAMGTPTAPNFANLFMAKLENEMLDKCPTKKPFTWLRYLDDVFFIWPHGKDELDKFLDYVQQYASTNNMKSKISYDVNISDDHVNFLDIKVNLKEGRLETDLFSKPTDSHTYLRFDSCHPQHTKKGILKSQFLRLNRICSDKSTLLRRIDEFKTYFRDQNYPIQQIENAIQDTFKHTPDTKKHDTKNSENITPCIVTFHPKLSYLSNILQSNYYKSDIEHNHDLKATFPRPPIVAFRKQPNLRNKLIRSDIVEKPRINRDTISNNNKCNKPRCKCCQHFLESNTITNKHSKKYVNVINGGNCSTKNCIYAITCKQCDLLYIGQTIRSINERFIAHKSDIKLNSKNIETVEHFNRANHSIDDLQITILDHKSDWNTQDRLFQEDFFISRLKSQEPTGLNRRCGDLTKYFYRCI